MIEAIIFDLDGVIVHTDNLHYLAWKKLADRLGIYFDRQINNRLRGVSRMDSLEILLEKSDATFTDEQKQALADEKNQTYRELLRNLTPNDVSEEVLNTLQSLRSMGLKLAVGSGSKNAPFILERVGLSGFFDAITDGSEISHGKPDPEVFLKAAQKLGMKPSQCGVVEDAEAGIEAALAGGMVAFAIGDATKCNKANHNLNSFGELATILRS